MKSNKPIIFFLCDLDVCDLTLTVLQEHLNVAEYDVGLFDLVKVNEPAHSDPGHEAVFSIVISDKLKNKTHRQKMNSRYKFMSSQTKFWNSLIFNLFIKQ